MSGRVDRPSIDLSLANAVERIRILESIVPEPGGGGTVFCVGCYEIDPEFSDCVNLTPGDCVPQSEVEDLFFNPTDPDEIENERPQIGPYGCNYAAGFRLQARYYGDMRGMKLWVQPVLVGDSPVNGEWTEMVTAPGGPPAHIESGWVTLLLDIGAVADNQSWELVVGFTNGSILTDGIYGAGTLCTRWVSLQDTVNPLPQPHAAGEMLVAVEVTTGIFQWVVLDAPTAPGQVLTSNGSNFPEWT